LISKDQIASNDELSLKYFKENKTRGYHVLVEQNVLMHFVVIFIEKGMFYFQTFLGYKLQITKVVLGKINSVVFM